ncbi:MAG: YjbE family putative metal transport protein [Alphaproteobacteria bacterium]|nr:YjbE family putative metal transport protein [Alphaproteobacteria bacterium]
MAGDNAVAIGMAAARVPERSRPRVIFRGLAGAVTLRVILAIFAMSLLHQLGLTLAGGILLLWVSWRLWRDLWHGRNETIGYNTIESHSSGRSTAVATPRMVRRAILRIVIADASMSLDNVLAVAGAAQGHYWVLVLGLVLSIGLMGVAVGFVAKLLHRYPWISYAGVFIVMYVAITMVVRGSSDIIHAM